MQVELSFYSEVVLLCRVLFSDCALWRCESFSVAARYWRYCACSQCGWLMGRVSAHGQFQINARYSAVEKRAEFNVQYNTALEFI